jgi:hypothetical protein
MINNIYNLYVHFCLPLCPVLKGAKTNQKGQPITRRFTAGPALRFYQALFETTGSLKTREVYTPLRGAQTSQTPVSAASLVLGCVKMAATKNLSHFDEIFPLGFVVN